MKKRILICISLVIIVLIGFFIVKPFEQEKEFYSPDTGNLLGTYLDKNTEKFLIGKWEVKELIGFTPIHADDDVLNYPYGQDIIGNEIIFDKSHFSTEGLIKYPEYQYEVNNPVYYISANYSNKDHSIIYFFKQYPDSPDIKESYVATMDDVVQILDVATNIPNDESRFLGPYEFYIINNERLVLPLDSAVFELKKVE